jgi:maltooligosyltrehalose trehalohydrolase
MNEPSLRLGAWRTGTDVHFRVWAPDRERIEIVLLDGDGTTELRSLTATRAQDGTFESVLHGAPGRVLYKIRVDGGGPFPDPLSRSQPQGVHGPSEVAALADVFAWTDGAFRGLELDGLVIYELHVGTFTREGTFEAVIAQLDYLRGLGVTAIELMPVASFPGRHNWGYDGVSLFAPAAPYGGPLGLKRLVDAAHARGLGVILDVVYNHLGPDGNYLRCFSDRWFTSRHHTPWGDALDFDGEASSMVREAFCQNAEMWIHDYHLDGLRLDAVHAIVDDSPRHVLADVAERARAAGVGRGVLIIGEDERNDRQLLAPTSQGGTALDGLWADDFHHAMRRAFAGDWEGYFGAFDGTTAQIAHILERGWLYEGQVSSVTGGPRGTPAGDLHPSRLVHCIQNHDQVGNRAAGDRLGAAVTAEAHRTMAALLLLSPYTPLLFMGQEWNAAEPFQYFTDHHAELGKLVTEGRRREFKAWKSFAGTDVPDPQAMETLLRSKLDHAAREHGEHAAMLRWYGALLGLRREHPAARDRARGTFAARAVGSAVVLERRVGERRLVVVANVKGSAQLDLDDARLRLILSSDEARFGGAERTATRRVSGAMVRFDGPGAVVLER